MSRILQIRRGNTTQNDNFTGLPGELYFDTENKTIRVHDGEMLGGYALARVSDVPTGEFDINSVPDEFWQNIVTEFAPPQLNIAISPDIPITSTTIIEYVCNYTDIKFVRVYLKCISNDCGFIAGDNVNAFGIGNFPVFVPNVSYSANQTHIALPVGGGAFWVMHKTTGVRQNITNANWRIKFSIYY